MQRNNISSDANEAEEAGEAGEAGAEYLWFRGIKNLDASIDWALAHGLDEATEVVVTGVV